MRLDAKTDSNQSEIVAALRKVGCSVELLHRVGRDSPDILVGRAGLNFLIECKSAGGQLSEGQQKWHEHWAGQVDVAWTLEDALQIVGLLSRRVRL